MEFHETQAGSHFYNRQLPKMLDNLTKIATALTTANILKEKELMLREKELVQREQMLLQNERNQTK